MRPGTIFLAFKTSGTWPVDQVVFTDDDYTPSIPYSTEAQDFPSLPDPPNNLDLGSLSESDSDSDSDSDLSSDSESDSSHHYQPINCRLHYLIKPFISHSQQ
jgi:hypothetical protein